MRKYGRLIPCWDCEEEKPRSAYHKSRLLSCCNICAECSNRRSKEWRKKNPDRVRAMNKKNSALRKTIPYADLPESATCRECGERKGKEGFYPAMLARSDYLCKPCANEYHNRYRRMKKGLPPKQEARPALPDWSAI